MHPIPNLCEAKTDRIKICVKFRLLGLMKTKDQMKDQMKDLDLGKMAAQKNSTIHH